MYYINRYAGSSNLHDRYVPEKCHDKKGSIN